MQILGALLYSLLSVPWTDLEAVYCWKICEKFTLYEHFWHQFFMYARGKQKIWQIS